MTPQVQGSAEQHTAPLETPRPAPVTARACIIGLLLIPLLVFWVEYTEIVAKGPDLAAMSLPMSVVFALLLLIPINLLVRRFAPRAALTQAELLLIYSMNVIAVYLSGIGMMQFLTPELVGWKHFATSENKWANWFDLVRPWSVPNPSVVHDYYAGKSSFFTPAHMAGWAGAIGVWSAFTFVLLACFYCIATLVRKQWVENERLIFPIVQIPLEITRDGGDSPIWRNRLFWYGVLLPVIFESLAAIHFTINPLMPYFPLKPEASLELDTNITTPPWNAMGYTTLAFYPMVIGLTFLLSLDVSFSCWFFYLFTKAESIGATAFGLRDPGAGPALSRIPYVTEQGVGAYVGLALFTLWLARPHLTSAWRRAFGRDRTLDDSNEPLSYRAAFVGLFLTMPLLVGFGVALGLSWGLSLLFFGLFLLLALTFTRIRAEAGLPWGQGPWGLSHGTLINFGGTQSFTAQNLTAFAFLRWFDSDFRCLSQPAQIEAMKMASAAQPRPLNQRQMTWALAAAVVVGLAAAWASCLGIYYHYGADSAILDTWRTAQGHYGFDDLQSQLTAALPMDKPRITAAVAGLLIVGVLSILRTRFVWWPLHPIGYAVGNTDTMTWIWFPTLLGWLFKSLILRYGGVKLYRQALPFFFGLVLGDYAISGIWALIFLTFHMPGYRTFPI
jgi:hypothetical protein